MKALFKLGSLFITLFVCFGYLGYTSSAGVLEPHPKERWAALSVSQSTRAKQLFKEKCARCHGADGRGQTVVGGMLDVPDFTDKAWWNDIEDDRLMESVRNGKGGMPKFGKKLTAEQIALLVSYVRRFDKSGK